MVDIFRSDFYCLDDVFWVNNKCSVVSKIYSFMYIIEVMSDFVCWVVNYCKFDFVDCVRRIVLCFVSEVSVSRY